MEQIDRCADLSIRRGIAFAGLGVFCVMAGLAYDPPLALRTAAVLCALMAVVLHWKGRRAPRAPYRRTEVWLLLDRSHGLPEARAQAVIGMALRRSYMRHAELAGMVAAGLWMLGVVIGLALPGPGPA